MTSIGLDDAMIDHPANIVSNCSSHNSFAGLAGNSNDGPQNPEQMSTTNYVNNPLANLPSYDGKQCRASSSNANTDTDTNMTISAATTATDSYQPSQVIASNNPLPTVPSSGLSVSSNSNNNTVPEFLYQLTKMLTGGHNDIIEWSNGRIEVHNPHKLESVVLQKYFRHSKFASFQRQLNYFGFRKLAGKGKMAPCSYVNESATQEIGSLLLIKRKPGPINPKEKSGRKGGKEKGTGKAPGNSTRKGIPHQQVNEAGLSKRPTVSAPPADGSQQAIARSAVGRGVRHSFGLGTATAGAAPGNTESSAHSRQVTSDEQHVSSSNNFTMPSGVEDSLSQLTSNYHNSLAGNSGNPAIEMPQESAPQQELDSFLGETDQSFSLLSRNSSLIDLAMLPNYDDTDLPDMPGFNFIDFPQPEIDPSRRQHSNAEETS